MTISEHCTITPAWPEVMTEEQWHELRATGIGGSDLGSICGVNKYASEIQVWAEKTENIPRKKLDNEAIKLGNRFERPIAEEFAERENKALVEWPVTLRSRSHPWMLANLDFLMVEPSAVHPAGKVTTWRTTAEPEGIIGIVEIKSTGLAGYGTAHQWGDEDDERVPPSYELQCRHYGIVSGIHDLWLVGLLGGRGVQVRRIEWSDVIADDIVDIESDFWNNHVLTGVAPEPDGSDSAEGTLKALYPVAESGTEIEGGSQLENLWHDYLTAKKAAEAAETERKALRLQIIKLIGKAEYATVHGRRIASFKSSEDGWELDEEKLKANEPDIYKQYLKKKYGHRSLREVKSK